MYKSHLLAIQSCCALYGHFYRPISCNEYALGSCSYVPFVNGLRVSCSLLLLVR